MKKDKAESYQHYAAKIVLRDWLRSGGVHYEPGCAYVEALGISVRCNRPAPSWGVYAEFPIDQYTQGFPWDERYEDQPAPLEPPSRDELAARGEYPEFFVDVGVIHKGFLRYAFEVVHTCPVPPRKLERLRDMDVHVIQVCAGRILRQVEMPSHWEAIAWR